MRIMLRKPIICREMNPGEEPSVCELVSQVFHEFVAPGYRQEGIEEFFRFADPDAMKERMQSGGFVLVAYQTDVLAGMLEFFPPDRIAILFVVIQHQGIAKELLTHAIRKARSINPDLSKVTVYSSPYAEPIYLKLGFNKIGNVRTEYGITYIPMELLF